MSDSLGPILIVALAMLAANQAFFSERIFGIVRVQKGKAFWLVLLEWLVGYFLLAGLCAALETRLYGSVYAQDGMFFWITLVLYAVLAFPGYVYRYLMQPLQKPRPAAPLAEDSSP